MEAMFSLALCSSCLQHTTHYMEMTSSLSPVTCVGASGPSLTSSLAVVCFGNSCKTRSIHDTRAFMYRALSGCEIMLSSG